MTTGSDRSLSIHDIRKERLVAACIEDRRKLHRLLTPPETPPPKPVSATVGLIRDAINFASSLPGPIGRWSRRLNFGSTLWDFVTAFAHSSR